MSISKKFVTITLFTIIFLLSCGSTEIFKLEPIKTEAETITEFPVFKGMILEIVEIKGVQKFIYFNVGADTIEKPIDQKLYKKGLMGEIFNDPGMKEMCAKLEVTDIYKKFSKAKISELSYKIDPKGVIMIDMNPKPKKEEEK